MSQSGRDQDQKNNCDRSNCPDRPAPSLLYQLARPSCYSHRPAQKEQRNDRPYRHNKTHHKSGKGHDYREQANHQQERAQDRAMGAFLPRRGAERFVACSERSKDFHLRYRDDYRHQDKENCDDSAGGLCRRFSLHTHEFKNK